MSRTPQHTPRLLKCSTIIGEATEAEIVQPDGLEPNDNMTVLDDASGPWSPTEWGEVRRVDTSQDATWRKKLLEILPLLELLDPDNRQCLCDLLADHDEAFYLDECELGETDTVQLQVDTGDTASRKQPHRRMPFAVHQEVAS